MEPVEIDFDAASAAWTANKIRRGASYVYRCMAICQNGNRCKKPAMDRYACQPCPCVIVCKSHSIHRPAKYCEDSSSGT
jgi:hypothetical protein